METMEKMLSMLLDGAVETLDISPHLYETAVARYEDVGAWLAEHGGPEWRIYPQGSALLGTMVRPKGATGEYDIDLVCRLVLAKESISQAELKKRVGDMLHAYLRWKRARGHHDAPKTIEERRRCWTLGYPDDGFHLDILPSLPDVEYPPTGILLTDKQLRFWQHSNPIGYATWFKERSQLQHLLEASAKRHPNVAEVPEWQIRTTLQRIVQILKWHCMLRFSDDPDNRPPSILLTTLAARAYTGQRDLYAATRDVLTGMDNFIEDRDGSWWIPNPAHPEENFADKWNEYPERREAFLKWHHDLRTELGDFVLLESKGIPTVIASMSRVFESAPFARSAQLLGEQAREQTRTGTLRMNTVGQLSAAAIGPAVRGHTFHGQHTDSRH